MCEIVLATGPCSDLPGPASSDRLGLLGGRLRPRGCPGRGGALDAAAPPGPARASATYSPLGVQIVLMLVSSRATTYSGSRSESGPAPHLVAERRTGRTTATGGCRDGRILSALLRPIDQTRSDAPIATNDPRINDRIRAREVRLVDPDGAQIGIRPLPEALQIAREQDLDLVEVAPPPTRPCAGSWTMASSSSSRTCSGKESRRKATNVVHQGDEVPAQDRRARLRHEDPQGGGVPVRGPRSRSRSCSGPGRSRTRSWAARSSTDRRAGRDIGKVESAPSWTGAT